MLVKKSSIYVVVTVRGLPVSTPMGRVKVLRDSKYCEAGFIFPTASIQ